MRFLVGTYTHSGGSEGILGCEYTGVAAGEPRLLARVQNPSWLALAPDGRHVYSVSETEETEGSPGGGVAAFRLDPETLALTELNRSGSGGGSPAHLAVSADGRWVVAANYGSGSVTAFPVEADGRLGPRSSHVQHEGHGPNPERQEAPHAHMVAFDPVTGDVLVPDLGLDAVIVYTLSESGELQERKEARIAAAPGAGPRHLAFHPNHQVLFCVNELGNTVAAYRRDGDRWEPLVTTSTLPAGTTGESTCAAVRVTASGRYVLATNRGPASDSVSVLRFDDGAGTLELVHVEPSGGSVPRELVISADGRYAVVGNQDSSSIVVMEIDEEAGTLTPLSSAEVPSPVCLVEV